MALAAGTRLGPYEILAPIGAGGMGEVYRAHDSRLDRDVAIKVSNAQFTERFTREARAIAALNHTNICHLYDVGPDYLVMEYVEGQDLGAALLRGPMDFDDALPIIHQLIDGIEAAHEKNIVHRDLKPANIKITPEGVVKILDFGLAKAMEPPPSNDGHPETSPTFTVGATQAGAILGTAAYMAPEQAKGKAADRRSDIWSFGVILFEMLAGKRLFQGESNVEVLGGVLNKEPDFSAVPLRARKLLRWCLEKDRKQRLASISDARRLLNESDVTDFAQQPAPLPPSRFGKLPWIAAAALAVATAVALWAPWRATRPVDRPLVRLDVDLGADVSLPTPGIASSVVISPDGTRLAYASGNPPKLFTRRLDQPKATELPGTEGATMPFFSPDGQWVGFVARDKLSKVSVEGGAVVPLADISSFAGASWGEDGNIIVIEFIKGLLRIPAGGGPPETLAGLADGESTLAFPQILPGGKAILFGASTTAIIADKGITEVLTLVDRRRKIVARGGGTPRFLATSAGVGHLVYVNEATLFAVPFDPHKLEMRGPAVPILDDVAHDSPGGAGQFDFSSAPSGHGTLIYRRASGGALAMTTLQWMDATGKATLKKEPLLAKPGVYKYPNVSPDGKRVALGVSEGRSADIWVYDSQRDTMTRLTFGEVLSSDPTWSPDGKYVVFSSAGKGGIFQVRADGASLPQALTESKSLQYPTSFTPDGKRLAYLEYAGNSQIWTMPLEEQGGQLKAGKPEQFLKSSFNDILAEFSPDGRWLAYASNESGKYEVYVRAFPPPSTERDAKWQISNSGGMRAHWSPNGHDLLYESVDQIMAVSYTVKGDTFVSDKPRVWIEKLDAQWDLAPDGKRVVVVTPVESAEAPKQEHEVVFLENFFDELRRRVPLGK
jgi:serine/threonine protein kinase/Tol biopolymer transport system component